MTEKIKQSERLAVLGRMAASLAHEIRTPLTSIKNLAQLLEEEYADPAFRKEFQELVVSEEERINRIIKALLTYAKPLNLQKGRVRLDNLIEETLAGLKEAGQMEKIRIKKSLKPIEVKANKDLIRQVLENIILNACEAMAGQGTISISLYQEGQNVVISVKDSGPGIKEKDKPHIFMPFFTTKTKGTGLGLALCEKIITAHGGKITFHTQKGKGTTFYIYLPME
jgi:signal transduction histidine kinase